MKYILGNTDPALFGEALFWATIGVFFVLLIGTRLRDPQSQYSPTHFSWRYLFSDNAKRIYASIIAVLASLRFMPELFGWELSAWKGFVIGMGWDTIALIVKQKTNLLDPKPKQ